MKRKRTLGILVTAMLCLFASFAFIGCHKDGPGGASGSSKPSGSDQIKKIDEASVVFDETDAKFIMSWKPVIGATEYDVTVDGKKFTVNTYKFDMRADGVTLSSSGSINVSIVGRGKGYKDSEPLTITYTTEGLVLRSPQVTSFENGKLTWRPVDGAGSYLLTVNGKTVTPDSETSYTLADKTTDADIQITAQGDGVWLKDSATTAIKYSAAAGKLALSPAECRLNGETLEWGELSGVKGYKVVDLEFNVRTVTTTSVDLSASNLIYGVYPISNIKFVADAEIVPAKIPYLEGNGTKTNPYLIKTPFDLRAIDYYEMKYANEGGGGTRKYYRIENDIDYDIVNKVEAESNVYTLSKPFYGNLDGNGKTLSNMRVAYDGGFWALFDFIAKGATVENLKIKKATISNEMQDDAHPINASIATIANQNFGTISNVSVSEADYTASGGEVAGIVLHNYGTVKNCAISGSFKQKSTGYPGQGCFAMGGIVLENCAGGTVTGCSVDKLTIDGDQAFQAIRTTYKKPDGTDGWHYTNDTSKPKYNIMMAVGGIVAVNRRSGTVKSNYLISLTVTKVDSRCGGIVARNEGGTVDSNDAKGSLSVNGSAVKTATGAAGNKFFGTTIGRNGAETEAL